MAAYKSLYMSILELYDKQIEEAAAFMRARILEMAKPEKEKRKILEEVDKLKYGFKAINRMTDGAIGPLLCDLFGMKNIYGQ